MSTGDVDAYDPKHPDAPTPESAVVLKRSRKPLYLRSVDDYIYDHREDAFLDGAGTVVTPEQILESAYIRHCRTASDRWFLVRWKAESALLWLVHHAVWNGQDAAMWLLVRLYDVELLDKKLRHPFHRYKSGEFRRVTETPEIGGSSHFFGFQSSRKSFFTNLVFVATVCVALYLKGPRTGLLRTIYNNTALTTAALVLAFLVSDVLGPALLIRTICLLSRLRAAVTFVTRKVRI